MRVVKAGAAVTGMHNVNKYTLNIVSKSKVNYMAKTTVIMQVVNMRPSAAGMHNVSKHTMNNVSKDGGNNKAKAEGVIRSDAHIYRERSACSSWGATL
eukprot:3003539-Amphidinium_carterae.1